MSEFKLTVVTPDGVVYDGMAESVIVRTTTGNVGILKDHAPFVAPLTVGEARVKFGDDWKKAACIGGVVNADKEEVKIAANAFEWADDIDLVRAENAKKEAEKIIGSSSDIAQLDKAKGKLLRAITRINVANNK